MYNVPAQCICTCTLYIQCTMYMYIFEVYCVNTCRVPEKYCVDCLLSNFWVTAKGHFVTFVSISQTTGDVDCWIYDFVEAHHVSKNLNFHSFFWIFLGLYSNEIKILHCTSGHLHLQ